MSVGNVAMVLLLFAVCCWVLRLACSMMYAVQSPKSGRTSIQISRGNAIPVTIHKEPTLSLFG